LTNEKQVAKIIDGGILIRDVLQAAHDRCCGAPQETPRKHIQIVEHWVAAGTQATDKLHFQQL
jgi:hypothetical protein